jgi:hypothetical protein
LHTRCLVKKQHAHVLPIARVVLVAQHKAISATKIVAKTFSTFETLPRSEPRCEPPPHLEDHADQCHASTQVVVVVVVVVVIKSI